MLSTIESSYKSKSVQKQQKTSCST